MTAFHDTMLCEFAKKSGSSKMEKQKTKMKKNSGSQIGTKMKAIPRITH